jgi:hypothetical protein
MIYSGLFAAAFVSLILTIVSVFFLRKRGPWGSIWTFFLVLFLALGTLSVYITPIGPVYWGIAWLPITIAGIIITILLIAAMPHETRKDGPPIEQGLNPALAPKSMELASSPVGRFFWVLIILLVIAIMIGMSNPQSAL